MFQQNKELPKLANPKLVIRKAARNLKVFDGEKLVKTYSVVLGFAPEGDKEIEGDGKTPEGEFYISTKNPASKFHLGLGISYPAKEDAIRGLKEKLITVDEYDLIGKAIDEKKMPQQKTKLGGEVYIHGGGIEGDWTHGCIALKNEEIQEIYDAIPAGTRVSILP